MSRRQIDDERRYNSDLIAELSDESTTLQAEATVLKNQISLLKNENERLTKHVEDYEAENAELKEGLKHIKRWANSYNVHVEPRIILEAVVRMCDDALLAAEEQEDEN